MSQRISKTLKIIRSKSSRKTPKSNLNRRRSAIQPIPAAFSTKSTTYSDMKTRKDGSISLSVAEVFHVMPNGTGLTVMVPGCPTKWTDTRTASLARNYTAYRPTKLSVQWLPAISTSSTGYVAIGSVYNGGRVSGDDNDVDAMTKFCVSSAGGVMSTAWRPVTTSFPLGSNLSKNTYPTYQVSELDDIPLWVLFVKSNADTTGYLRVTATFILRNPIVGITNPPISGSGTATFVNGDTGTTMTLAKSAISGLLSKGQQLLITTASRLVNKAGETISNILGGIIAQLTGTDNDNYIFSVSHDINSQTAKAYIIGRHENF